jgi:protocatechuate 3,4-dioxygenase beta subunit
LARSDGDVGLRGFVIVRDQGTDVERTVTSTEHGEFEIGHLAAGQYSLTATIDGFATKQFGAIEDGDIGATLVIGAHDRLDIVVEMERLASIEGRVTTEDGAPITGARVEAVNLGAASPKLTLQVVDVPETTTDDRGIYRLSSVPPGQFAVLVVPNPTPVEAGREAGRLTRTVLSSRFYPSAMEATQSTPVRVVAGAELHGIDVVLPRSPAIRLTGQLRLPSGEPATGARVELSLDQGVAFGRPGTERPTTTNATGRFLFSDLQPGNYQMFATLSQGSSRIVSGLSQGYWTEATFSVSDSDQDVTIVLQDSCQPSGKVVVAPGPQLSISDLVVRLTRTDNPRRYWARRTQRLDGDGAFLFSATPCGHYLLEVRQINGSVSRSGAPKQISVTQLGPVRHFATSQIIDLSKGKEQADVVVDNSSAEIAGQCRFAPSLTSNCYIFLIPTSRLQTDLTEPRPLAFVVSPAREFLLRGVPPGYYYARALVDVDPSGPLARKRLPPWGNDSVIVELRAGQRLLQDLQAKPWGGTD